MFLMGNFISERLATDWVGVEIMLWACVCKMPGSDFSQDTAYLDWG
jgi:hypothetical protein